MLNMGFILTKSSEKPTSKWIMSIYFFSISRELIPFLSSIVALQPFAVLRVF